MKEYRPSYMKALYSIILLAAVFIACEKSDITNENDYLNSYEAWLKFKVENNNSYRYITTTSSWAGMASETTITVQNGKITGRDYVKTVFDYEDNEVKVVEQWQENEENLNTHENYGPLLKLDEIYHLAETQWLKKQKGVQTYFENNNNGMISSCGYVPNGCQDDCFIGINIKLIEKL
jgi:major membrane immunogen (membrane-anchored lipoprotein)